MADDDLTKVVTFETKGNVAIITLCAEKKLNAMSQGAYYRIGYLLNEIAKRDDIHITVLTGKGRYFSAGADVSIGGSAPTNLTPEDVRLYWLRNFLVNNIEVTRAFYTHPKILVAALNGPAVGLSAALVAFADFIYCTPQTFVLTPFSSLGLVAEGNASRAFVTRMGIAKANEALLMSKRIPSEELLQAGFVNKIFDIDVKKEGSQKFLDAVLQEVDDRLGSHLIPSSLIKIKSLIRKPEIDILEKQGIEEAYTGLTRFLDGIPQKEFQKVASGQKKHKL